jgi:hypothetical protein
MTPPEIAEFNARRDAVFRNPTLKGAKTLMPEPPEGWQAPDVPLRALHKARLQWLDATDAMLAESIRWLEARGYETTWHGAPPLTPAQRDADRMSLGKEPLR